MYLVFTFLLKITIIACIYRVQMRASNKNLSCNFSFCLNLQNRLTKCWLNSNAVILWWSKRNKSTKKLLKNQINLFFVENERTLHVDWFMCNLNYSKHSERMWVELFTFVVFLYWHNNLYVIPSKCCTKEWWVKAKFYNPF